MRGENIICFAKDWSETPTSNNHVMMELAKHNRVLWLNSVATRAPAWSSGRDLGRIARKLGEFVAGPRHEGAGLWVFSPLVLPWPQSRAAAIANRRIIAATIARLASRWGMRDYQLWSFLPNVADYLEDAAPSLSVYYCVDEWSLFRHLDGDAIARAEAKLCRGVDVVFAACEELAEQKRRFNPRTFVAPHGVDHPAFARALDPDTVVPADLAELPRPRIGFYGTINDAVDAALVRAVAERRPEWSIVLIGPQIGDVSALANLPNVHLLGRREHRDLPAYCKGFDVGIIPYAPDERMRYVNPLKAREYLSAGLPVVSTPVPEVERMAECVVARGPEAFEAAIARALAEDSPARRRARSDAMKNETWQRRVEQVSARIATIKEEKCRRRATA